MGILRPLPKSGWSLSPVASAADDARWQHQRVAELREASVAERLVWEQDYPQHLGQGRAYDEVLLSPNSPIQSL